MEVRSRMVGKQQMRRRENMILKAIIALFACVSAAQAETRAIWEVYPRLICKYDLGQFCALNMQACQPTKGEAVLTFDFTKNTVTSFGSKTPEQIGGKYHYDANGAVPDTNAVFAEATLFSFLKITKAAIAMDTDTVEGTPQTASQYDAFAAHMTCHPAA